MKNHDLEYIVQGFFTCFVPVSKAGEVAYNQLHKQNEDSGKIYTAHLKSTLAQLRKAGYLIRKAPKRAPISAAEMDAMLAELIA